VVVTAGVPGLSAEEAAARALEVLNQTVGTREQSYVMRKVMRDTVPSQGVLTLAAGRAHRGRLVREVRRRGGCFPLGRVVGVGRRGRGGGKRRRGRWC